MAIIVVKNQAEIDALPESFSEFTYIEIRCTTERVVVRKAWGNSSVVARGNSSVEAWGNSSVEAWENSSVVARGNSSVVAWENSIVEAWGNSIVEAWGNCAVRVRSTEVSVELYAFVAVWLIEKCKKIVKHSKTITIIEPKTVEGIEGWYEAEAVAPNKDKVILYKRVSSKFQTQEGTENETNWKVGSTVTHPKWEPATRECGAGKFHATSRPYFADEFRSVKGDRYIAIEINVEDLHHWPNGDYPHKIAFREGKVLMEVNRLGKAVAQ
jgi:hypothetical protein